MKHFNFLDFLGKEIVDTCYMTTTNKTIRGKVTVNGQESECLDNISSVTSLGIIYRAYCPSINSYVYFLLGGMSTGKADDLNDNLNFESAYVNALIRPVTYEFLGTELSKAVTVAEEIIKNMHYMFVHD